MVGSRYGQFMNSVSWTLLVWVPVLSVPSRLYWLWGGSLHNLCDSFSMAAREFNVFSQQVVQLAALWQAIEPSIFKPESHISPETQSTLIVFHGETIRLLGEVRRTVYQYYDDEKRITEAEYKQRSWNPDIGGIDGIRSRRNRRLRQFLKRSDVRLQREQIESTKTSLLVILDVIRWAITFFNSLRLLTMSQIHSLGHSIQ